jgi:hypothetical protein
LAKCGGLTWRSSRANRDGQAPAQFTQQLLKDWGFSSSNDRAFIPLLKALGFLSPDGKPTTVYHDYRDHSRSKAVMGAAMKTAYEDIFLIKEHPTDSDRAAIQGKFKSFHNASDNVASLMTKTFLALLKLADLKDTSSGGPKKPKEESRETDQEPTNGKVRREREPEKPVFSGLHYNIQIHLPATKDVEVYNAIFKSLRGHLLD